MHLGVLFSCLVLAGVASTFPTYDGSFSQMHGHQGPFDKEALQKRATSLRRREALQEGPIKSLRRRNDTDGSSSAAKSDEFLTVGTLGGIEDGTSSGVGTAGGVGAVHGGGTSFSATITSYQDCNTVGACGWFPHSGYTAAASSALYDSPSTGAIGHKCGSCWRVEGFENTSRVPTKYNSIVVIVNNECPIEGNPPCNQQTLQDKNSLGANVNFDLCSSSGAAAAFFGSPAGGMAIGRATEVSCTEWVGVNGTVAKWAEGQ